MKKIAQKILACVLALSAMTSLAILPTSAIAQSQQQYSRSAPYIEAFSVEEVRRLVPGVELNFVLYGSPGGQATLRIAGANRNLYLVEVDAGQYEGTYTLSRRDRVAARSPVTANLRVGNRVASAVLNESLQVGVGFHPKPIAQSPQLRIERFSVQPVEDFDRGSELHFRVQGTPGGSADVAVAGVRAKILLEEVNSGEYVASYRIRGRDRVQPNSLVTANLRVGDRITSATLGKPLQVAVVPVAAPVAQPVARVCHNCGVVEAVNLIEVRGRGNYLGTIGGGVVGALIGSQVGGGSGRTAAQVVGAVGGAYAGNRIEANSRKDKHYEVVIRFNNGATQAITFEADPGYRIGDKVRVTEGVISRQ